MVHPKQEKTVVLIKPDGVKRGLIGEVISRIEDRGLKIVALEMFQATRDQIDRHYPKEEKWIRRIGKKTLKNYQQYGVEVKEELGTEDTLEIGKMVRGWLLDYLTSGPMVKMVVQGVHAVNMARKIVGSSMPAQAEMGTIRGDFSVDDATVANREKRAIYNIVHASENPQEAQHELGFWFSAEDVFKYKRTEEEVF